jgi:hypothetical protein
MKLSCKNSSLLTAILLLFSQTVYSQINTGKSSLHSLTSPPKHIYKIIKEEVAQQENIKYFHNLLSDALTLGNDQYGTFKLERVSFKYSQSRTLKLLNFPDALDVTYSMTSVEREREYLAIPIPLLNGLFGKRRLLVKSKDKEKFETMTQPQLKALTACQGLHWPDYEILKQNGYKVYGVIEFESNVKMLMKGRCNYFPRSIQEIDLDFKELNGKYGQLAKVDSILLQYQAPVYFFVGKHNTELAQRLAQGLKRLQTNGEMNRLLMKEQRCHYDKTFEKNPELKIFHLNNR